MTSICNTHRSNKLKRKYLFFEESQKKPSIRRKEGFLGLQ